MGCPGFSTWLSDPHPLNLPYVVFLGCVQLAEVAFFGEERKGRHDIWLATKSRAQTLAWDPAPPLFSMLLSGLFPTNIYPGWRSSVSCEPSKMERELVVSPLSGLLCSQSSRTHPCGHFGRPESQSKAVGRKATGVRSWHRGRGSCGLCLQCKYQRRIFTNPVSLGTR